MPDLASAPETHGATPGQLALARWVHRQMASLCVDAIMAGQTTATEVQAVLHRWRHHPACPAWRGDACALGCDAGGKAQ